MWYRVEPKRTDHGSWVLGYVPEDLLTCNTFGAMPWRALVWGVCMQGHMWVCVHVLIEARSQLWVLFLRGCLPGLDSADWPVGLRGLPVYATSLCTYWCIQSYLGCCAYLAFLHGFWG